ncbi:uncharacterized protein RAG0_05137 [Rhynchosporium agropyri]|uniref:Uncharacterized protein n=1 Tax=Rhynchosporium agropyri TaxID=914238 RepID=A0A1E1KBW5_9HELO|nr:uncharacterized protein RAG0_05137 [Rhynchosporium agropyri]
MPSDRPNSLFLIVSHFDLRKSDANVFIKAFKTLPDGIKNLGPLLLLHLKTEVVLGTRRWFGADSQVAGLEEVIFSTIPGRAREFAAAQGILFADYVPLTGSDIERQRHE